MNFNGSHHSKTKPNKTEKRRKAACAKETRCDSTLSETGATYGFEKSSGLWHTPSKDPGTAWEMCGVSLNFTYGRTPKTVTKKKGPCLFSTLMVPPLPGWYTHREGAIPLANGLGILDAFLDHYSHPV